MWARMCRGSRFFGLPPPGGSPPGVFVKNRKRSPGVLCFPPGRSDFRKIQDLVDLPCISSVDLTYTVNNTSAAEYVSHTRVAELCGRCRQPLRQRRICMARRPSTKISTHTHTRMAGGKRVIRHVIFSDPPVGYPVSRPQSLLILNRDHFAAN